MRCSRLGHTGMTLFVHLPEYVGRGASSVSSSYCIEIGEQTVTNSFRTAQLPGGVDVYVSAYSITKLVSFFPSPSHLRASISRPSLCSSARWLSVRTFTVLTSPLHQLSDSLTGQLRRGGTAVQEDTGDPGKIVGAGASKYCHNFEQPGDDVVESGEGPWEFPGTS